MALALWRVESLFMCLSGSGAVILQLRPRSSRFTEKLKGKVSFSVPALLAWLMELKDYV